MALPDDDLTESRPSSLLIRLAMAGVAIFALALVWAGASRQLGNMVAEISQSSSDDAEDLASIAADLSGDDPSVQALLASSAADAAASISRYERAVELAPHDHRHRVSLARAYERAGRFSDAERQFHYAILIAPNHAYPRWHFGNFLLRQGQDPEAIAELKNAARDHLIFRDQVFALGWDYYQGDATAVAAMAADDSESKAYLAKFLASHGAGDKAVQVWRSIPEPERQIHLNTARLALTLLLERRRFRDALDLAADLGSTTAKPGQVTNPSFEQPLKAEFPTFSWETAAAQPRVEISADTRHRRTGERSVRLTFRNYDRPTFADLFQTVVVEPKIRYRLTLWVRTENLKSLNRPFLDIVDACTNNSLGASAAFPPDQAEWTSSSIAFTAPSECSAVSIGTTRFGCDGGCPLSGTLYYDDFELTSEQSAAEPK